MRQAALVEAFDDVIEKSEHGALALCRVDALGPAARLGRYACSGCHRDRDPSAPLDRNVRLEPSVLDAKLARQAQKLAFREVDQLTSERLARAPAHG
jgi:hypothetical protein